MPTVRMVEFGSLLLTRGRGRDIVHQLPKHDRLQLDMEGVEVASPSFLDEVIKGAFDAGVQAISFLNVSDRTVESLELLRSLRSENGDDRPLLEVAT